MQAFDFDVPVSFFEKADAEPGKERRIGGIATLETKDRQGEVILARGVDFSDFVQNGWFNDNHSKNTTDILGYPEKAKFFRKNEQLPNGEVSTAAGHWVEGYLLNTPGADKVWELGRALAQTKRRLGFSVEGRIEKRTGPLQKTIARALVRNVAITNCFPGDVQISGVAEHATRRFYSGPMVKVVLVSGEKLTGTPNHPVLTQRGWVALGELDERSDRVGRFDSDLLSLSPEPGSPSSTPGVVSHDVKHVPTTLEQLFNLSSDDSPGLLHRVRSIRKGEFHGDALANGEVDVVPVKGELKDCLDAAFFQKFGQHALSASDKEAQFLACERTSFYLAAARSLCAASGVRSLGELLTLEWGSLTVTEQLLFTAIARYTFALRDVEDGLAADAIAFRDAGRSLSEAIGFSDLVSKRVFDFSGHVYNLSTVHGWFAANGIVAHNCPVNSGARMEILAKSLQAAGLDEDLEKMLGMGTATPGAPITGPQSGMGAGRVIAPQSLEHDEANTVEDEDEKKKRKKRMKKSMTEGEAFVWLRARLPHATPEQLGRIITLTRTGKGRVE